MSYDGLQRFISGTGKNYFYTSSYIQSANLDFNFTTNSSGSIFRGVSINLDIPTELQGKSLTVIPLLRKMTCISSPGEFLNLSGYEPFGTVNYGTNTIGFAIPVEGYLVGGGPVMALYQNTPFIIRIQIASILIA